MPLHRTRQAVPYAIKNMRKVERQAPLLNALQDYYRVKVVNIFTAKKPCMPFVKDRKVGGNRVSNRGEGLKKSLVRRRGRATT